MSYVRTPSPLPLPAGERESRASPQSFEDADVIGDGGAAHIEDTAKLGILDLHVAGCAGELHRGERMHGYAGGADRMALGLKATGRIDRQPAVLGHRAVGDDARALPFRRKTHGL